MEDRTWKLVGRIGIGGGLLLYLLAITGEILGWWNDLGLLVGLGGLLASLLGVLASLWPHVRGQGRRLILALTGLADGIESALQSIQALHRKQEAMLGKQDARLSG